MTDNNKNKFSGLDGVEPNINTAHHMQLVNSIINDGSLANLVFSNGSLNTEYIQHNKGEVARMMQGNNSQQGVRRSNYHEHEGSDALGDMGLESEDGEDGDYDEDDDEHIIVTMLKSMNSKKLECRQLKDMKLEIDIEKIRSEMKMEYFRTIQQKFD